jgi:hypothetical protein
VHIQARIVVGSLSDPGDRARVGANSAGNGVDLNPAIAIPAKYARESSVHLQIGSYMASRHREFSDADWMNRPIMSADGIG